MTILMEDEALLNQLSHFGVKGMKWGSRKTTASTSHTQKRGDNSSRNKKIAAAVGVGVAVTALVLLKNQKKPARDLQSILEAKGYLNKAAAGAMKTKMSDVPRATPAAAKKATVSPEAKALLAKMRAAHQDTLRLANEDLKRGYNRNETPFALREYISLWDD